MDDIILDGEVIVDKFCRISIVPQNSAHLCCSQKNVFGFFGFKKGLHFILPHQIEFTMGSANEVGKAFVLQFLHDCGTYQAAMTGYVDFGCSFHI